VLIGYIGLLSKRALRLFVLHLRIELWLATDPLVGRGLHSIIYLDALASITIIYFVLYKSKAWNQEHGHLIDLQ
jgi:hypothetical protein